MRSEKKIRVVRAAKLDNFCAKAYLIAGVVFAEETAVHAELAIVAEPG